MAAKGIVPAAGRTVDSMLRSMSPDSRSRAVIAILRYVLTRPPGCRAVAVDIVLELLDQLEREGVRVSTGLVASDLLDVHRDLLLDD